MLLDNQTLKKGGFLKTRVYSQKKMGLELNSRQLQSINMGRTLNSRNLLLIKKNHDKKNLVGFPYSTNSGIKYYVILGIFYDDIGR